MSKTYISHAEQKMVLNGTTSGQLTHTVPVAVSSYTLTWPATLTPTPGFHLASDEFGVLSWASPAGTLGIINGGNSMGAAITIGTNDNFGFNFETNGTNKMTIAAGGNVAITTGDFEVTAGLSTFNGINADGLVSVVAGGDLSVVDGDFTFGTSGGPNGEIKSFGNAKFRIGKGIDLFNTADTKSCVARYPGAATTDSTFFFPTVNMTLPTVQATAGQILSSDASGVTSWINFTPTMTVDTTNARTMTGISADSAVRFTAASGATAVTLNAATSGGQIYTIINNQTAGAVTITRDGTDTIDGTATSIVLANPHDRVTLLSNGAGTWYTM